MGEATEILKIPSRRRQKQREKEWVASLRRRWRPSIENQSTRFVKEHSKIDLEQATNLLRRIRNSFIKTECLKSLLRTMVGIDPQNFTMKMTK